VDHLRAALRDSAASKVLAYYFCGIYTDKLADLLIYVDRGGVRRQVMVQHGDTNEHRTLRGEKFLYVILFTEDTLVSDANDAPRAAPAPKPDTGKCACAPAATGTLPDSGGRTVIVSRTALDYQSDPFLVTLVKGFGPKLFGGSLSRRRTRCPIRPSRGSSTGWDPERMGPRST